MTLNPSSVPSQASWAARTEDVPELPLLSDYVAHYSRSRSKITALSCDEFDTPYAALPATVDAYAAALLSSGTRPGDVVAVIGYSRPECLLVFLACCRVGAIFLGLNPKHTEPELAYIVADARPRRILGLHSPDDTVQNEKLEALRSGMPFIEEVVTRGKTEREATFPLEEFLARARRSGGDFPTGSPNAACALVYTSGSTGAPKGALLSQAGMIRSSLLSWRYWYGASPRLRSVAQHPINHVGWLVCECICVMIGGGSLFFRERFDGTGPLRLIEAKRLNLWIAFPSMVMLAMESPEFSKCDLSSLERLALGSLPSMEVLPRLRERTDAVFSVSYGLTEANGGALTVTDDDARLETVAGSIGRPLPGVEMRILPQVGDEATDNAPGELLVRDACNFLGYLNRPEATALTLDADGWLHTGDVVVREPDGNLRLVGRLKEMFKSGGYNVYPTEIETIICTHPGVSGVAVVEAPDPLWQEVGVAFVLPKPGQRVSADELRQYCRARLANFKVPKRFEIVGDLPQLANGKFDKVQLRQRARWAADGDPQSTA